MNKLRNNKISFYSILTRLIFEIENINFDLLLKKYSPVAYELFFTFLIFFLPKRVFITKAQIGWKHWPVEIFSWGVDTFFIEMINTEWSVTLVQTLFLIKPGFQVLRTIVTSLKFVPKKCYEEANPVRTLVSSNSLLTRQEYEKRTLQVDRFQNRMNQKVMKND